MTIKISFDKLGSYNFDQAFQKLATTQLNGPSAFRVMDVVKAVEEARTAMKDEFLNKCLKEMVVFDGDKPVQDSESGVNFKLKPGVTKEQYLEMSNGFGKREAEIKTTKLSQQTLETAFKEFSAMELMVLEPLYTRLTEVPTDAVLNS